MKKRSFLILFNLIILINCKGEELIKISSIERFNNGRGLRYWIEIKNNVYRVFEGDKGIKQGYMIPYKTNLIGKGKYLLPAVTIKHTIPVNEKTKKKKNYKDILKVNIEKR